MGKYFLDILRHKYFKFDGRSGRKEFWLFHIWYALIMFVLSILFFTSAVLLEDNNGAANIIPIVLGLVMLLFGILVVIPLIALTVRRLHDAGLSGWLALFLLVFPAINIIFGLIPPTAGKNQYD